MKNDNTFDPLMLKVRILYKCKRVSDFMKMVLKRMKIMDNKSHFLGEADLCRSSFFLDIEAIK